MDPPHLMRGAWRPAPAGLPQDGSRGRAASAPAEPGPANADKGEAPPAPPPRGSRRPRVAHALLIFMPHASLTAEDPNGQQSLRAARVAPPRARFAKTKTALKST